MICNQDRMKTTRRTAIQKVYRKQGIEPSSRKYFGCPEDSCPKNKCLARDRKYWTGTWPYIGAHYGEAKVLGRSIRVLFVAMDRGGKKPPEREFADTQKVFRERTVEPQNPHMGGTSQLMGCLVESEDRELYSGQFALTNAVKCVKATGRMSCGATQKMFDKCSEHLSEEIRVLRPHLVITQGVKPGETILDLEEPFEPRLIRSFGKGKAKVLRGSSFIILTTPHPAFKPRWKTKNGPLPKFLQNAVRCAASAISETR